jgi:hypothetical protein
MKVENTFKPRPGCPLAVASNVVSKEKGKRAHNATGGSVISFKDCVK